MSRGADTIIYMAQMKAKIKRHDFKRRKGSTIFVEATSKIPYTESLMPSSFSWSSKSVSSEECFDSKFSILKSRRVPESFEW